MTRKLDNALQYPRLATTQASAAASSTKAPPRLKLIGGAGIDPAEVARTWNLSEYGNALPRTHRCYRVTISRYQTTPKMRELSDRLNEATDRLAATDHAQEAREDWNRIVVEAILTPGGRALPRGVKGLREKIALAAAIAGVRFEHGGLRTAGPSSFKVETPAEWAFAALDDAVWSLCCAHERKTIRQRARPRRDPQARRQPQ